MVDSEDAEKRKKLDMKRSAFDCDAYLSGLLKKKGLDELVQVEEDMVQNVTFPFLSLFSVFFNEAKHDCL